MQNLQIKLRVTKIFCICNVLYVTKIWTIQKGVNILQDTTFMKQHLIVKITHLKETA